MPTHLPRHANRRANPTAAPLSSVRPPLLFQANRGQAPSQNKLLARGAGYSLMLTDQHATLALRGGAAVRMRWLGANPSATVEANAPVQARTHYLKGSQADWITGVENFERAVYHDVYPATDLLFHGARGGLEYDFRLRPGADPLAVKLQFEGVDRFEIAKNGDLILHVGDAELVQRKPVAWQDGPHGRELVQARFRPLGQGRFGFDLGRYDRSRTLIVDPFIDYATYLGKGDVDVLSDVAVDSAGNAYVVGYTASSDFPVNVGDQSQGGQEDAFLAKLSPDGVTLIYATFIGGGDLDRAWGVAVNDAGEAFVVGETRSDDFPTSVNAFLQRFGGGARDGFAVKVSASGSSLAWSTYLGDTDDDWANGVAIDEQGSAYVCGGTWSSRFPTTAGVVQEGFGGDDSDAFVIKLDPMGSRAEFSTFLGGSRDDEARSIALGPAGDVYVTGFTRSNNFPLSAGAFQSSRSGGEDAFVSKLNPTGSRFGFSTLLGGGESDYGNAIAVDLFGDVYVAGSTASDNFPTRTPGLYPNYAGGIDAFVTKFDTSGGTPLYSTYLGGRREDAANGVAVDPNGFVSVVGHTKSEDFPVSDANVIQGQRADESGDGFWSRLSEDGRYLLDSTYLGGDRLDEARAVALGDNGSVYVGGRTLSNNLAVTTGSYQQKRSGEDDGFLFRIVDNLQIATTSAASYSATAPVAPESIASAFGRGLATVTQAATSTPLPAQIGGTRVVVTDAAGFDRTAALFFVSPTQLNFEVPPGTAAGLAQVTVFLNGSEIARGTVRVRTASPSLFSANATGLGAAAAQIAQAEGGQTTTTLAFTTGPIGQRVAIPIDLGGPARESVLILYGTGIRGRRSIEVLVDGEPQLVLFDGAQSQFIGLDQVNVQLSRTLAGAGLVDVNVLVDGFPSNVVQVFIQ
ncbi:MAG: SBBP repeat-containing protein [Bryobacterales bacterium]